ncbi:hypothetical protein PQQ88_12440 [Paraburkholderia caledonica]|uniref:hypothetical protein n=1 Tax=Paraburkholderia caledonica TaxID=134536 RepID=UPI0038B81E73
MALFFLVGAYLRLWLRCRMQRAAPNDAARDPYSTYAEDVIYGYRWQWAFSPYREAKAITMLCPVCMNELEPGVVDSFHEVRVECDVCGYMSEEDVPGKSNELLTFVIGREIERRARAGDWATASDRLAASKYGSIPPRRRI